MGFSSQCYVQILQLCELKPTGCGKPRITQYIEYTILLIVFVSFFILSLFHTVRRIGPSKTSLLHSSLGTAIFIMILILCIYVWLVISFRAYYGFAIGAQHPYDFVILFYTLSWQASAFPRLKLRFFLVNGYTSICKGPLLILTLISVMLLSVHALLFLIIAFKQDSIPLRVCLGFSCFINLYLFFLFIVASITTIKAIRKELPNIAQLYSTKLKVAAFMGVFTTFVHFILSALQFAGCVLFTQRWEIQCIDLLEQVFLEVIPFTLTFLSIWMEVKREKKEGMYSITIHKTRLISSRRSTSLNRWYITHQEDQKEEILDLTLLNQSEALTHDKLQDLEKRLQN